MFMPVSPAEITPLLLMPPANVVVLSTSMAVPLLTTILPAAATWMPPETMPPLTRMPTPVARILPLSLIAP